jgi:hypothetical protein
MAAMPSCHNVSRRLSGSSGERGRACGLAVCSGGRGGGNSGQTQKFWTCPMPPPDGRSRHRYAGRSGRRPSHHPRGPPAWDVVTLFLPLVTWLVVGEGRAIAGGGNDALSFVSYRRRR